MASLHDDASAVGHLQHEAVLAGDVLECESGFGGVLYKDGHGFVHKFVPGLGVGGALFLFLCLGLGVHFTIITTLL